jgi:hypothetical protein
MWSASTSGGGGVTRGTCRFALMKRERVQIAIRKSGCQPRTSCGVHQPSLVLAAEYANVNGVRNWTAAHLTDLAEGPTGQGRDDIGQQTSSNRPP